MVFYIITGMSGSGKSRTMATLEDQGFYCVDNMPITFLPQFAEICMQATADQYDRVALATDVRAGEDLSLLTGLLDRVQAIGCEYKILFLECTDKVLINRYKETRRRHPLMTSGVTMSEAIAKEREMLHEIKSRADYIIDTTNLSVNQLREAIIRLMTGSSEGLLNINLMSFGFKYGVPTEADMMFDVRFLPNPYYEIRLRPKNGTDAEVRDYVFRDGRAEELMNHLRAFADFLIPQYVQEGKAMLTIAIGCTGGRHRSVAIAEELRAYLTGKGYQPSITHRDSEKG
ncbi:MAG: RNase adapter RapZ [Butyricicoccaceae bacterium]